jgi:hypothetical protein
MHRSHVCVSKGYKVLPIPIGFFSILHDFYLDPELVHINISTPSNPGSNPGHGNAQTLSRWDILFLDHFVFDRAHHLVTTLLIIIYYKLASINLLNDITGRTPLFVVIINPFHIKMEC